jgi:hypothetical protein
MLTEQPQCRLGPHGSWHRQKCGKAKVAMWVVVSLSLLACVYLAKVRP